MLNARLQIRSRLRLSNFIGRSVQLKTAGNGEYKGLCPFHPEQTPSFTVSDRKEFYHCFGCGAHGDIVDFVQKMQGYTPFEALKRLADEAGVALPKRSEVAKERAQEVLLEIVEQATQYYQRCLLTSDGQLAMQYLKKRGLKPEVIADYRLGYAPKEAKELQSLLEKSFKLEDILNAKVLLRGNYGLYNPFGGRVIFPIANRIGQIIAFGGRVLDSDKDGKGPKYLNSSESEIFDKGATLYGLHFARKEAQHSEQILVVEGYMDVVSLANNGIRNAVAPLGTSIKAKQIEELWGVVNEPIICMDSDAAGQKAAHRLAHEIIPKLKVGKSISFMNTGKSKDPDEFIITHGVAAFKALVKQPTSLAQLLFDEAQKGMVSDTPEHRLAFKEQLIAIAGSMSDHKLQQSYRQYFLDKFYHYMREKNFQASRGARNSSSTNARQKQKQAESKNITAKLMGVMGRGEDSFIVPMLCAIAEYPELLQHKPMVEALINVELTIESLDRIRNSIIKMRDCDGQLFDNCLQDVRRELFQYSNNVRFDDVEEARSTVELTMKVCDLKTVQRQIAETAALLTDKPEEAGVTRLIKLKEYEGILKSQLNFL